MNIVRYNKGTKLYKTVSFPCPSIKSYMDSFPKQPCRTNKMLWLTEDLERALSYGSELKVFTLKDDIELWNLMENDLHEFFMENIDDEEFFGLRNTILRIVAEGSLNIKEQGLSLYGLLTGSGPFSVKRQLSILKAIRSKIDVFNESISFDGQTLGQIMITPDNKRFDEVINEYIDIGKKLSGEEKELTNQRLSIYGLDQILLKLMCFNEKLLNKDLKGWCVPSGTQTVWAEYVDGKRVSDMGEIALFDCSNLVECELPTGALKKKRKKKRTKKRTKKRRKRTKKTKKRTKKRKNYKRKITKRK